MRHPNAHPSLRLASAMTGATLLLAMVAPAAHAGWSGTTIEPSWFLTRPSLRVDDADHQRIAYQRSGDEPGILFTSDATGSWIDERVTSGPDYAPALAIDGGGHDQIVFARLGDAPGVYQTDDATGSWSAPTLIAADLDPGEVSIAIDGAGKLHVAYASDYSFAPGVYYVTNATGSWVRTRITSGTYDAHASLALDAVGHVHVAFARLAPEAPGVYVTTNAAGPWVATRLSTGQDAWSRLSIDGAGHRHVTFSRIARGSEAIYYATDATGPWVTAKLPSAVGSDYGPAAFGIDGDGTVHIFAGLQLHGRVYSSYGGLTHWAYVNGGWVGGDAPFEGGDDQFPSLGWTSSHALRLAFRRAEPTQGIRSYAFGISSSLVAAGSQATGPAIALGPTGIQHVAYERAGGEGSVAIHATNPGAAWTMQDVGPVDPKWWSDIAVDSTDHVRIVHGSTYLSNATGPWTSDTTLPFGARGQVEVDPAGHTHIAYVNDIPPYYTIEYRSDKTGSWVDDSPWPATTFEDDVMATLAVDATGHAFVIFKVDDKLWFRKQESFGWSPAIVVGSANQWWPAMTLDATGKIHMAYLQTGAAPGVYYVTNKTGSWVRTRLTHSTSDGRPSIALDAAGRAFVATTRASWAASPGIYLSTNASGPWETTRVLSDEDAGDVSLDVTAAGLRRLVFETTTGVQAYEETALAGSAVARVLRDQVRFERDGLLPGTEGSPGHPGAASHRPGPAGQRHGS